MMPRKTVKPKPVAERSLRMESIRMPVDFAMEIAGEMEKGIARNRRLCYIVTLKMGGLNPTLRKHGKKFREKFNLRKSEFDG